MSASSDYEPCARCGRPVGVGNLARDYRGTQVCDDCFTTLVDREGAGDRSARYLGAWRERIARLFRK